jgi:hypothetical protein
MRFAVIVVENVNTIVSVMGFSNAVGMRIALDKEKMPVTIHDDRVKFWEAIGTVDQLNTKESLMQLGEKRAAQLNEERSDT